MKRNKYAQIIAALALFFLVTACRTSRSHGFTKTTAKIGGDGKTNTVETVKFESSLDVLNGKLELDKVKLTESFGEDGWDYGVGFDKGSASPDNTFVNRLAQIGAGYLGRDIQLESPETDKRLAFIEEKLAAQDETFAEIKALLAGGQAEE